MRFMKSSCKTRPDPIYYRDKANRWIEQRNRIFEQVEAAEAETGQEAKQLRYKAYRLDAKVKWAIMQIVVAQGIRKNALEAVSHN